MLSMILPVLIGAGIGAGLGYFGQCSSGTCPLTSTWWRGALYGGAMGLVFGLTSPRTSSADMSKSSPYVKNIAQAAFESEVAKADIPVLVDFYAPWCGPCRRLAPEIEKLAEQFSGKIKFVKVNVDEAPDLAGRYNISSIPTVMIFQEGKVIDTIAGVPGGQLKERLESLLKS